MIFYIGQKVLLHNIFGFESLNGKTGTVIRLTPNEGFKYRVCIDGMDRSVYRNFEINGDEMMSLDDPNEIIKELL